MAERLFKLPISGLKSLAGDRWVNALTADMLIEVLYPMIEPQCDVIPDREKALAFLECHYPLHDKSLTLNQLAEMLLIFLKGE